MPSARATIRASPDNRSSLDAGIRRKLCVSFRNESRDQHTTTGRVTARARRTRWAAIHCQPAADGRRAGAGHEAVSRLTRTCQDGSRGQSSLERQAARAYRSVSTEFRPDWPYLATAEGSRPAL